MKGGRVFSMFTPNLFLIFQGVFDFGEIEFVTGAPLEDVEDVFARRLKVGRGVVRFRNEELASDSVFHRSEHVANL